MEFLEKTEIQESPATRILALICEDLGPAEAGAAQLRALGLRTNEVGPLKPGDVSGKGHRERSQAFLPGSWGRGNTFFSDARLGSPLPTPARGCRQDLGVAGGVGINLLGLLGADWQLSGR